MRLLTPVSLLIVLISVSAAQVTSPAAQAPVTDVRYENSKDGLKNFLDVILAAAKSGDKAKVDELIKQTEIPNYGTWFRKEYAADKAESWIGPYGENLKSNEEILARRFSDFANRQGMIGTRKVEEKDQTTHGLEWGMLHSSRDQLDLYYAGWIDEVDGKPRIEPIGHFIYIEGMFRWDSNIRFVLPNRSPAGNAQDAEMPQGPASGSAPGSRTFNGEPAHVSVKVSAPIPISSPDPDVRKLPRSKQQGIVVLSVIVDTDGLAKNIKVQRSLDAERDQLAIDAVSKWRFKPSMREGAPVAVAVNIEVSFNLY